LSYNCSAEGISHAQYCINVLFNVYSCVVFYSLFFCGSSHLCATIIKLRSNEGVKVAKKSCWIKAATSASLKKSS
jgi:hypothetical protein